MAIKDQAITIAYVAWNTSTNVGQTGDSANHTIKLLQDGVEGPPTNAPAQIDSTNWPGWYSLALTAGDMNFNCVVVGGKSSTANVVLIGPTIATERGNINAGGNLPGAASGLAIVGSNMGAVSSVTGNVGGNVVGSVGSVTGNVGGNVVGSTASVTGAVGSVTGNVGGNVVGSVGSISGITFPVRFSSLAIDVSGNVTFNNTTIGTVTTVTNPVSISLTETLGAARALDSIADTSLTLNDAFHCAIAGAVGKKDASSGTSYIVMTPSTGTTLRTYTLTLISPPSTVPDKAV